VQAPCLGTQGAAEVGEALAEVGEGLALGAVGPEGAGEKGALDVASGAKSQESEEPEALAGAEMREGSGVEADLHRPEEAEGERWGAAVSSRSRR
jgi:hypothetical protein